MRRRSAIAWTSVGATETAVDGPAEPDPAAVPHDPPPPDRVIPLDLVRDRLAELVRSPPLRADSEASAILSRLVDAQDAETLDDVLDALVARADAMVAEGAARRRPEPVRSPAGDGAALHAVPGLRRRLFRL